MSIFNLKKAKKPCCCCGSTPSTSTDTNQCCGKSVEGIFSVKVLGAGCASCHQQFEFAKEAAKNLGLAIEVEYITDMSKVMEYGVMSMPALVINERVASMGKVLKAAEVEKLLLNPYF